MNLSLFLKTGLLNTLDTKINLHRKLDRPKISSKIDPVSGYTINKTNLIIRYDTLFQSFSVVEQRDLLLNRGFVGLVSILLIFTAVIVFHQKRLGKFEIKLLPLKEL